MQALISDPDKIMIIGDDDQAIYSWRGASPEVLLNVCCDYSIKKLYLSTNYRCGRNIVDFSATGVKNNSIREEKKMLAYNDGGVIEFKPTSTELYDCSNDVAKLIKELHDKDGVDYEDICVLARYNQDLSLLNSILFNQGIYTHIPREATITYGKLFKDFKGLIDFIGGEDWLLDKSTIALNGWKIASYFDKKTSKLISNGMKSTGYNTVKMLECIADSSNNDIVCSSIRNRMKFETISDIKNFVRIIKSKNTNEDKAIAILKHHIGVTSWLYRSDRSKRLVNGTFKLFRDMLKVYGFVEARRMIRNIELYEKGQIASIGSCVNLSTCHRSKGREWRVVILLADDNKSFPSLEDINRCCTNGVSREDIYSWIEEERRLHYVAKTRAKEKLILAFDKDDMSLFTLECFGNYYSSEDIINIANKGVPKPETDLESAKKIGVVLE
jgi:DNA helicase-2/ATP-dependent DNA helicase PcrA